MPCTGQDRDKAHAFKQRAGAFWYFILHGLMIAVNYCRQIWSARTILFLIAVNIGCIATLQPGNLAASGQVLFFFPEHAKALGISLSFCREGTWKDEDDFSTILCESCPEFRTNLRSTKSNNINSLPHRMHIHTTQVGTSIAVT